jgi:MFS transporter, Spinster family, sphingosine-1-phosphate transporter
VPFLTRGIHVIMQPSSSRSAVVSAQSVGVLPAIGGKYFALTILFSMNLLNYVDRYSFFAVGTHIQKDLGIGARGYGVLSASFMIVYTIVTPLIGWLGDRYNRRVLLASGVGLWSLATVGTAFSEDFSQMFFWRALLGVGEASYGVIAPALLADLYEPKDRGWAMGRYYLALPLGGALGYGIGGWVGETWGWPVAFWVVGLPGLVAAVGGLIISDPGRGASEGKAHAGHVDRPKLADYWDLFRTPTFVYNTLGMAAVTFATGGYAAWGSTFYQTVRGMSSKHAGIWIGGLTALAGLLGIWFGTRLADVLVRFSRRGYLLMASAAVLIAIPFGFFGILDPDRVSSLGLLFVAMIMLASVLGPCNAVTANVVPANRRASGYALSIFLIHLLGDISSPILIGDIADRFGKPDLAHSWPGELLSLLGAVPVGETNLTVGMLSVAPVLLLGCLFFFFGSRHLAADQDRARQLGGGEPEEGVLIP